MKKAIIIITAIISQLYAGIAIRDARNNLTPKYRSSASLEVYAVEYDGDNVDVYIRGTSKGCDIIDMLSYPIN